jgi:hypothetical protein
MEPRLRRMRTQLTLMTTVSLTLTGSGEVLLLLPSTKVTVTLTSLSQSQPPWKADTGLTSGSCTTSPNNTFLTALVTLMCALTEETWLLHSQACRTLLTPFQETGTTNTRELRETAKTTKSTLTSIHGQPLTDQTLPTSMLPLRTQLSLPEFKTQSSSTPTLMELSLTVD